MGRTQKRQNFKSIERSAFFVVRTPIDRTNKPTPEATTEVLIRPKSMDFDNGPTAQRA